MWGGGRSQPAEMSEEPGFLHCHLVPVTPLHPGPLQWPPNGPPRFCPLLPSARKCPLPASAREIFPEGRLCCGHNDSSLAPLGNHPLCRRSRPCLCLPVSPRPPLQGLSLLCCKPQAAAQWPPAVGSVSAQSTSTPTASLQAPPDPTYRQGRGRGGDRDIGRRSPASERHRLGCSRAVSDTQHPSVLGQVSPVPKQQALEGRSLMFHLLSLPVPRITPAHSRSPPTHSGSPVPACTQWVPGVLRASCWVLELAGLGDHAAQSLSAGPVYSRDTLSG